MLQPLSRQLGVVEVAIAIGNLLIERSRHKRLVVFLSQTGAPIESRGSFRARGIKGNLFFESLLGFGVAPLPQGEPGCFPVDIRTPRTVGKALLRLAEG